jgi:hypothetical protein
MKKISQKYLKKILESLKEQIEDDEEDTFDPDDVENLSNIRKWAKGTELEKEPTKDLEKDFPQEPEEKEEPKERERYKPDPTFTKLTDRTDEYCPLGKDGKVINNINFYAYVVTGTDKNIHPTLEIDILFHLAGTREFAASHTNVRTSDLRPTKDGFRIGNVWHDMEATFGRIHMFNVINLIKKQVDKEFETSPTRDKFHMFDWIGSKVAYARESSIRDLFQSQIHVLNGRTFGYTLLFRLRESEALNNPVKFYYYIGKKFDRFIKLIANLKELQSNESFTISKQRESR